MAVVDAWEHRPLLWGLAYRMTGTVQDADDVVQDTWVRMLERPPATDRPLRPWLVAVTLNLARDRLRARRRAGWTGPWLPEPVPDTRLADDRLAMRQTASWAFLCRAEALTPTQRAVFLAREVLELSSAETAETLRVSTNVVDVTLHRARSILGKLPESPRLADDAVVLAFLAALQVGAVPVARRLLASDVVCINDGGGVVNAARVPITGVERLLRFFVRIQRLYPDGVSWRAMRCNGLLLFVGQPRGAIGRKPTLSTLFAEVEGGKIVRFTSQLTPAKLQAPYDRGESCRFLLGFRPRTAQAPQSPASPRALLAPAGCAPLSSRGPQQRGSAMKVRFDLGPRDAPCVVLLHGAGVAGWMWTCQLDALSQMRVVVLDLPDHGLARSEPFTSLAAVADSVAAWVRENVGQAHLIGHSLGARVVLELLSRHPEVARSAVISSALVRPSVLVTWMSNHTVNAMSLWMLRSAAVAKLQASQFGFPDPEMTAAWLADIAETQAENLDRPIAAFAASLSVPVGLDRVACPVLVTAGTAEPGAMIGSMDDIVAAVPGARAARLAGARHTYPWSRAEAYNRLLVDFFGVSG